MRQTFQQDFQMASQSASSSSSPSNSARAVTADTSVSFTYPIKLHTPKHRRAHVDWTKRQLRIWNNTS